MRASKHMLVCQWQQMAGSKCSPMQHRQDKGTPSRQATLQRAHQEQPFWSRAAAHEMRQDLWSLGPLPLMSLPSCPRSLLPQTRPHTGSALCQPRQSMIKTPLHALEPSSQSIMCAWHVHTKRQCLSLCTPGLPLGLPPCGSDNAGHSMPNPAAGCSRPACMHATATRFTNTIPYTPLRHVCCCRVKLAGPAAPKMLSSTQLALNQTRGQTPALSTYSLQAGSCHVCQHAVSTAPLPKPLQHATAFGASLHSRLRCSPVAAESPCHHNAALHQAGYALQDASIHHPPTRQAAALCMWHLH